MQQKHIYCITTWVCLRICIHICVHKHNSIWIYLSYIHQGICNFKKNVLLEGIILWDRNLAHASKRPCFKYPRVCIFSQQDLFRKIWLTTHQRHNLSPSLLIRSPDSCRSFFENASTWLRISIGMYNSTSGRWGACWQRKDKQLIFTVGSWTALWMNPRVGAYRRYIFLFIFFCCDSCESKSLCTTSLWA